MSPTTLILHSWHYLSSDEAQGKRCSASALHVTNATLFPKLTAFPQGCALFHQVLISMRSISDVALTMWVLPCRFAVWVLPKLFLVLLKFWMLGGGRKLKPQLWKTENWLSFLDYRLLSRRASNQWPHSAKGNSFQSECVIPTWISWWALRSHISWASWRSYISTGTWWTLLSNQPWRRTRRSKRAWRSLEACH